MQLLPGGERRDQVSRRVRCRAGDHPLGQCEDDFSRWQQDLQEHRRHSTVRECQASYCGREEGGRDEREEREGKREKGRERTK